MNYLRLLQELSMLKANEKKTAEQLRSLQEKRLRKLLTFAYEHSPYYHDAFEEAGLTAETVLTAPLSAFPTLDKTVLLEQFDRLVTVPDATQEGLRRFDQEDRATRAPYLGKYHVVHSSGSTGKPGYFLYDQAAWDQMLLGIIRGALWGMTMPQIMKLLTKGTRIVYLAATDGRYGGAMAVGDGIDGVGGRQLYLDVNAPLAQWEAELRMFRPNIIIGYPSAIKILAELTESGQTPLEPIRVVSCGEPLGGALRTYLGSVFHTLVVNFYGASESLALGVETDPAQGMVLFDDLNILETAEDGVYLTCLYNYAQPLIRYRSSDHLTLDPPKPGSSCPFTCATGLLGRSEDLLWFEDGRGDREFLHPLAIEGFCIEGLLDYQFRQTGPDLFEMLAETANNADQEAIRRELLLQMRAILLEKGLGYVQFYVQFTGCIRPDPQTGKKKLIVKDFEDRRRRA